MGKITVTKNTITHSIMQDIKFLSYFQIVGGVISILLVIVFITNYFLDGNTEWEYLISIMPVLIILVLLPAKSSNKSRKLVQSIYKNRFSIMVDTIANKTADARKDKQDGDYRWEYIITCVKSGKLPNMDKNDWEICDIGQKVYVIIDFGGATIKAFPQEKYILSDELMHMLI